MFKKVRRERTKTVPLFCNIASVDNGNLQVMKTCSEVFLLALESFDYMHIWLYEGEQNLVWISKGQITPFSLQTMFAVFIVPASFYHIGLGGRTKESIVGFKVVTKKKENSTQLSLTRIINACVDLNQQTGEALST